MTETLSIFGELETFIADDLYPYRYVITPILVAIGLAAAYVAYRLGAHRFVWQHRLQSALIGAPLLIVAIVLGNYLVSPLWERSSLNEDSPLVASGTGGSGASSDPYAPPTSSDAAMEKAFQPRTAFAGMFKGADDFHFGRGDALIIETEPGKHVVRFENFSVRNGPDLYVYLSKDVDGSEVEETLNLGKLKATDGAFNYEVPAGIDVKSVKSVVVWCRQFDVLFAVAALKMG